MKRPYKLHRGSLNEFLATLEIGECYWYQTTKDKYENERSNITLPKSRRPEAMKNMKFSTEIYRAVSSSIAEDVVYLIKITRIN